MPYYLYGLALYISVVIYEIRIITKNMRFCEYYEPCRGRWEREKLNKDRFMYDA